jgi:ABC-2 type transport system ATP-binding protein
MLLVDGFTKAYDDFVAVDNLSFEIRQGDIFGFIGPNGAGKTTTIRFLSTLLTPTRGSAVINGFDVVRQPEKVKRSIGYMPDDYGVYDGMRVWEFLDFFGAAYAIPRKKRRTVINDILILLDLQYKRDSMVNSLSRGMRQRLCLAKTLVHDPPVLILDEPASGLDPRARIEIKELLKELRDMGKTILISSHILSELADCCNTVGILERGKLLAAGNVHDIMAELREAVAVEMEVLEGAEIAERILLENGFVRDLVASERTFTFEFTGRTFDLAELHNQLHCAGVKILWFKELETSLEDVFMKITKGEVT